MNCQELTKLKQFYPELSFDAEVEAQPELGEFLRLAIQKHSMTVIDPIAIADAPKFNDDFSNYFVINNLPKCKEDKIAKLVTLIESTLKKKQLKIEPADIEIPIN